jgi:hypothetical protein
MTNYTIYYPSGLIFTVCGAFEGTLTDEGEFMPSIQHVGKDDSILFLDPRGVITKQGSVLHDPRKPAADLPEWAQDWLQEHPEWPPHDLRTGT